MTIIKPELPSIFSLKRENIDSFFPSYERYRKDQILEWIYKKMVFSPDKMSNLPINLRQELSKKFDIVHPKVITKKETADGTEKFLLELYDKKTIEAVKIDSIKRKTFCLSTQVGCPIGCNFCASGAFGLDRNLTSSEIVGQFISLVNQTTCLPDNLVFMGIGEGLLNFDNLVEALERITSEKYINYAQRRITISTSGIPEKIVKLAKLKKQYNLAISLHAVNDIIRAQLIPDKTRYPIKDILSSAEKYFNETGRIITIEYTLIDGINNSRKDAIDLAHIAKKLHSKINIIPYNETSMKNYKRPNDVNCLNFLREVEKITHNVTMRLEKGGDINAACGQLMINKSKSYTQVSCKLLACSKTGK